MCRSSLEWVVKRALSPVLGLALALVWCLHVPHASAEPVDLRLVLAVDASGSVNETRFELQKQGYAAAFRNPRVLRAIQSGPNRKIALTMAQWTGPALQVQVTPWTVVGDAASMQAYAAAIEAAPRRLFSGGTSISGAIDFGVRLLADCPFTAPRSVIDVSGDGVNNRGRLATTARDEAVAAGIVINGLPILELDPTLDQYYLSNVIGGSNAFMIAAETFDGFADAILRKLILEIAGEPVPQSRITRRWTPRSQFAQMQRETPRVSSPQKRLEVCKRC